MKDKLLSFFSAAYIFRLYHTVKYLKWQQVFYRLFYPLKRLIFNCVSNKTYYYNESSKDVDQIDLFADFDGHFFVYSNDIGLYSPNTNTFLFLNKPHSFGAVIDWHFRANGLLWSFHLHYFDWLNDEKFSVESNLDTILQYIDKQDKGYLFTHSYPTSLRIVNWVKFLIKNKNYTSSIIASLKSQTKRLYHFPEYEIMGNHLLQNGIALVWAGVFLNDKKVLQKGSNILLEQLSEQVLVDGVHFEKSFAYQSILVKNLMDLVVFLSSKNEYENLLNKIKIKTKMMLSTLSVLVDQEGFYFCVADSNKEMSINFNELMIVAQNLSLNMEDICLSESGFRVLGQGADYQLFFNSGSVMAAYQPGHSHADAFSVCLNVKGRPVIVDRGVSTYESNEIRKLERSTIAHNTLNVNLENSADVWAAFRMGERPSVFCLSDDTKSIDYKHKGYFSKYKIWHRRRIEQVDNIIEISDYLYGWKGQKAQLVFHFHPDRKVTVKDKIIEIDNIKIFFTSCSFIIEDYLFCEGFDRTRIAKRVVCSVEAERVITYIKII